MRTFRVENLQNHIKEGSTKALKFRDMLISGMGIPPFQFTTSGMAQCDTNVIRKLAGKAPAAGKYGLAYEHFKALGQEEQGI